LPWARGCRKATGFSTFLKRSIYVIELPKSSEPEWVVVWYFGAQLETLSLGLSLKTASFL